MRPSKYPMIAFEDARAIVLASTSMLQAGPAQLLNAVGRTIAEDVCAPESLPPFAASAVDGYAVRATDGTLPRRVLGEITAGVRGERLVEPGTAVRIMTGAPLPEGADAVVMVEDAKEAGGQVDVSRDVLPGANVVPVGLDVVAGQVVLRRGTRLGAAEVAMLATIGREQVMVYRAPTVAVLSTGDELVEPSSAVGEGRIRDSNRYGLLAAVAEADGIGVSLGIVRDDETEQERRIRQGLEQADVLLTSGGVSVGSRDLIKPILERLGKVHFGRVAIRPGKPVTLATVGEKMVFGLPGFPVSSLVAFELFVRPVLLRAQGRREVWRPEVTAVLEHKVSATPDRVEFQRADLRAAGARVLARVTGVQASSRLMSLVGANGLLRIPPGTGELAAGTEVTALLIGPLGEGASGILEQRREN